MTTNFKPAIIVPPGATLAETLETLKISQRELALRADLSEKHISQIINGSATITPETAIRLERVLGIEAAFWSNLEARYQEGLARKKNEELIKNEISILKNMPCYSDLARLNFVKKTNKKEDRVKELLKFFRIQSLELAPETTGVAFRTTGKKSQSQSPYCISAWIRCGQIIAENQNLTPFEPKRLRGIMDEIRKLTTKRDFEKELQATFNKVGVGLVFLPKFKGTKVNGATFWHKGNPVIQLNTKGKFNDIFWFTLFHEIGHILKHGKKDLFIEEEKKLADEKEREADEFAANTLIPQSLYKDFLKSYRNGVTNSSIKNFARKITIHPAIIAGRLAHDGMLEWSHARALRVKLDLHLNEQKHHTQ